jgi:hypothetical protein
MNEGVSVLSDPGGGILYRCTRRGDHFTCNGRFSTTPTPTAMANSSKSLFHLTADSSQNTDGHKGLPKRDAWTAKEQEVSALWESFLYKEEEEGVVADVTRGTEKDRPVKRRPRGMGKSLTSLPQLDLHKMSEFDRVLRSLDMSAIEPFQFHSHSSSPSFSSPALGGHVHRERKDSFAHTLNNARSEVLLLARSLPDRTTGPFLTDLDPHAQNLSYFGQDATAGLDPLEDPSHLFQSPFFDVESAEKLLQSSKKKRRGSLSSEEGLPKRMLPFETGMDRKTYREYSDIVRKIGEDPEDLLSLTNLLVFFIFQVSSTSFPSPSYSSSSSSSSSSSHPVHV